MRSRSRTDRRRVVAALAFASVAAAGRTARAETGPFASISGGGGALFESRRGVPTGTPDHEDDQFVQGEGHLGFLLDRPRFTQIAEYGALFRATFGDTKDQTLGHLVNYGVTLETGRDSLLTLALTGSASTARELATLRAPGDPSSGGALPPASSTLVLTGGALESFTTAFSARWGFVQTSTFTAIDTPDADAVAPFTAEERAGPSYTVGDDVFRVDADGILLRVPDLATPTSGDYQIAFGPTFVWTHAFSTLVSSTLEAGGLAVSDLSHSQKIVVSPVGAARLRYADDTGSVEGFVTRAVVPSLFTGALITTYFGGVTGRKPVLENNKLALEGTLGARRSETILASGGSSPFTTLVADVGVTFAPFRVLSGSIRYQFESQDPTGTPAEPIFGFTRHTVLALVTLSLGPNPRVPPTPPLETPAGAQATEGIGAVAPVAGEGDGRPQTPRREDSSPAPPPRDLPVW